MQKYSTLYHYLTFLGYFCNSGKLSVFKQQHVYKQNKHGKGYPRLFLLKLKMQNIIIINTKEKLTNKMTPQAKHISCGE